MDLSWIFGLVLLLVGAELLLRSLVQIASSYRLSKFALGMTLAAFAVSAPLALFSQTNDIAGSIALSTMIDCNIANIGLVLGLFLIFSPLRPPTEMKWLIMPLLFLVYLILFLIMLGGKVSQVEGVYLLMILALYIISQFFFVPRKSGTSNKIPFLSIFLVLCAISFLIWGTLLFSDSTLFAVRGLSFPLLAVALIGILRKEGEILLGTVIGSCALNLLLTIPIHAIAAPIFFSQKILLVEFPLMVAFALLLWVLTVFGKRLLSRLDGALLLLSYAAYMGYLFFS